MSSEERIQQKIQEVFDNEKTLDAVFSADNPDALMQVFSDLNIVFEDVTKEEVFQAFQNAKTGELSEEDLENVSGGVYLAIKAGCVYFAVSGSIAGALCVAGGVALIGLAAYAGYRYIRKKTR